MDISFAKKHKVFRISDPSVAVVIPKAIVDHLEIIEGATVLIGIDLETDRIVIEKYEENDQENE